MSRRAAGSFSARNGAAWHREGADYRKRSERRRLDHTAAGQFGRISPLSEQAVRVAINAQACPWCGAGPYKNIGLHTNLAHGVSAVELRKLAGLSSGASICAPELSARARDNLINRPDRWETTRKATSASVAVGAQRQASTAWSAKARDTNRERDERIVALFAEGLLFSQIAEQVGVSSSHIRRIIRRNGVDCSDGRSVRFRNGEFRTKAIQNLGHALEAKRIKIDALRTGRIARYVDLGSDWSAIHRLAGEWQISAKSVAAYLKKSGVDVPDGRSDGPIRGRPSGGEGAQ